MCFGLHSTTRVKAPFIFPLLDTGSSPLIPTWPLRFPGSSVECARTGGHRGEALRWRVAVLPTFSIAHLSWWPGQEIKAQRLPSHTPLGQRPPTMNGLSATLNVASLFINKFGNVWTCLTGPDPGSVVHSESSGDFTPLFQPQIFRLVLSRRAMEHF